MRAAKCISKGITRILMPSYGGNEWMNEWMNGWMEIATFQNETKHTVNGERTPFCEIINRTQFRRVNLEYMNPGKRLEESGALFFITSNEFRIWYGWGGECLPSEHYLFERKRYSLINIVFSTFKLWPIPITNITEKAPVKLTENKFPTQTNRHLLMKCSCFYFYFFSCFAFYSPEYTSDRRRKWKPSSTKKHQIKISLLTAHVTVHDKFTNEPLKTKKEAERERKKKITNTKHTK